MAWFHVGGATHVVNGIVAASETTTTLFDAAISGESRSELRVVGKVTIPEATFTEYWTDLCVWEQWKTVDFEHIDGSGSGPYHDEDNNAWSFTKVAGNTATLAMTSAYKAHGSYSWKTRVDSTIYVLGQAYASLSLPGGYSYRVRVKVYLLTSNSKAKLIVGASTVDSTTTSDEWVELDSGVVSVPTTTSLRLQVEDSAVGTTEADAHWDTLVIDRMPLYEAPFSNNPLIDIQTTEAGVDWDNSTTGWETHLTVDPTTGTVVATACPYPREMQLRIECRKYVVQDDTTVSFTPPDDELANPFDA
jgi:hypothetical protein